MRTLILTLAACDQPDPQLQQRDLDLGPGCAYDIHHDGLTGCVQDAALCYADLATFCEFDFWACRSWSEWCAEDVQQRLKEAGGNG